MIEMSKLKRKHIGRRVIYDSAPVRDTGVITSFNEQWIFVRFDDAHRTSNGIACSPLNLRLIAEPKQADK